MLIVVGLLVLAGPMPVVPVVLAMVTSAVAVLMCAPGVFALTVVMAGVAACVANFLAEVVALLAVLLLY